MSVKPFHVADVAPVRIDVLERGQAIREGARSAILGEAIKLSIEGLQDFFFSEWRADLVDLLIIAACVEYCDLSHRRPAWGWARSFDLRIAVHDESTWNAEPVRAALEEALSFLTGDRWSLSFVNRVQAVDRVGPRKFELDTPDRVIIPYSDGLDSRAVAALVENAERGGLVRVRLGSKGADTRGPKRRRRFTTVPFDVKLRRRERIESSARSRGFKFAIITGIAAQLAGLQRVVVTESGQGALGPILVPTGQTYPDYRVHPAFTRRVEKVFEVLSDKAPPRYEYPRIWRTKAETLRDANALETPPTWRDTRSCWQDARSVSVDGHRRQCGICAACMLRRMSIHVASIEEPATEYVLENLRAGEVRDGLAPSFTRMTKALDEYAIAGVLHLDHLAGLARSNIHSRTVSRVARETADALGEELDQGERQLRELLDRHRAEWLDFLASLGPGSFVSRIAGVSPWQ